MTPSASSLFDILQQHYGSGQSIRIARLLMSIHNGRTKISFFNDLQGFDTRIQILVTKVICEFFTGHYKDGDFNPIAEWLVDENGYLDDVDKENRKEWIDIRSTELRSAYHNLPPRHRIPDCAEYESFETFCNRRWREVEYR